MGVSDLSEASDRVTSRGLAVPGPGIAVLLALPAAGPLVVEIQGIEIGFQEG